MPIWCEPRRVRALLSHFAINFDPRADGRGIAPAWHDAAVAHGRRTADGLTSPLGRPCLPAQLVEMGQELAADDLEHAFDVGVSLLLASSESLVEASGQPRRAAASRAQPAKRPPASPATSRRTRGSSRGSPSPPSLPPGSRPSPQSRTSRAVNPITRASSCSAAAPRAIGRSGTRIWRTAHAPINASPRSAPDPRRPRQRGLHPRRHKRRH